MSTADLIAVAATSDRATLAITKSQREERP